MQKFNINTLVLHRIVKNKILNFEDVLEDVFDDMFKRYIQHKTFLTVDSAFSKKVENDCICLTFDDGFKSDVEHFYFAVETWPATIRNTWLSKA